MKMNRRTALALAALSMLLAGGCSRPDITEQFIKAKDALDGRYSFDLVLDSLEVYDISFFTRIDSPIRTYDAAPMRLDVVWISPSRESAGETVYMDSAMQCEKYRSGISPGETGKWRIEVNVPEQPDGFRGLGIICENNGTR